jgi:hypothetical protein
VGIVHNIKRCNPAEFEGLECRCDIFARSSAVSTVFGVNWASVATKLTVNGTTFDGCGKAGA